VPFKKHLDISNSNGKKKDGTGAMQGRVWIELELKEKN
jgi:hypothetical protein